MTTASFVGDAEQEPDQVPSADHLRDEVERHHRQRADRGRDPDRHLTKPEGHDVGKGVTAEIPERFRDEKHHDGPAHEESHRVDQPVEPRERHEAGDAEKAGRTHVVARKREAVLEGRDAASGRVELVGGPRLARRPDR